MLLNNPFPELMIIVLGAFRDIPLVCRESLKCLSLRLDENLDLNPTLPTDVHNPLADRGISFY
jgi:hypothetical protein